MAALLSLARPTSLIVTVPIPIATGSITMSNDDSFPIATMASRRAAKVPSASVDELDSFVASKMYYPEYVPLVPASSIF